MATIFKPKGRSKHVIQYFDENGIRRKVTGATDKAVTKRIANKIESDITERRRGTLDPRAERFASHEAATMSFHLADWHRDIQARGKTPRHRASAH